MYLRLGWNQIKKNIAMNTFVTLQLFIVFLLSICVSSIIVYHYQYYHFFADYFEKEGWYYYTDYTMLENDNGCTDSSELEEKLKKTDVIACYDIWADFLSDKGENLQLTSWVYDKEIVDAYKPKLESGKWLNEVAREQNTLHAVISENKYGLRVGDVIYLTNGAEQQRQIKIQIVGVLKESTKIVGVSSQISTDTKDYQNMYYPFCLEDESTPVILMDKEEINQVFKNYEDVTILTLMTNNVLIRYHDDISKEEISYNEEKLTAFVSFAFRYRMSEIRENSKKTLKDKLMAYVPIFICAFILTMLSAVCVSAIVIKQQLRNYAIYNICGMRWSGCAAINRMNTLFETLVAFILAILLVGVLSLTGLLDKTTISLGYIPILICVVTAGVYILLASIIPAILIRGYSTREILVDNQ